MMKGGLGGLMKQAQQMQQNMQKAQAELATVEVEGQAGSGMVKVTMTCGHDPDQYSWRAEPLSILAGQGSKGVQQGLLFPGGVQLQPGKKL